MVFKRSSVVMLKKSAMVIMFEAVGSYLPFSQNEIIPLLTCRATANSGWVNPRSNRKYLRFCEKYIINLSILIKLQKYLTS